MKLNNIKGFNGINLMSEDGDYCKVSISTKEGMESFWISDLDKTDDGVYTGMVDNYLVLSDVHGLKYGDKVKFEVIE